MTSPQTSTGRRISFKDPELDNLYANINQELYTRNIDRPFHWEEIDGTSMLFIYDSVRFVRHRGESKVTCEIFLPNCGWGKAPAPLARMLPVMWPIKKAQINTVALSNFLNNCTVGSVVQKHVNEFYVRHPQYKMQEDLKKNLNQMCFVCEKKWQHRKARINSINTRGAVRFWWSNFVDRSVLRTIVSVVGNRSSTSVSWKDFADLSSHPSLEKIQANLIDLGVARQSLAGQSFDQWACASLEQVVPQGLQSHWNQIQQEPVTIQETLINIFHYRGMRSSDIESVWNNYTALKNTGAKWSTRELNMLMNASCEAFETEDDIFQTKELAPIMEKTIKKTLPYISQCVKLWRRSYPQQYHKWSKENQQQWRSTMREVCEYSHEKQLFTLPPTHQFEDMRAVYEKEQINNALKENNIETNPSKRRRAM